MTRVDDSRSTWKPFNGNKHTHTRTHHTRYRCSCEPKYEIYVGILIRPNTLRILFLCICTNLCKNFDLLLLKHSWTRNRNLKRREKYKSDFKYLSAIYWLLLYCQSSTAMGALMLSISMLMCFICSYERKQLLNLYSVFSSNKVSHKVSECVRAFVVIDSGFNLINF